MFISLNNIIEFLVKSVANMNIIIFVEESNRLGMRQIPYVKSSLDANLPEFDYGYRYQFETDNNIPVTLEVLEKMGKILQAGIQLYYKPSILFSKSKKHYELLLNKLLDLYGHAYPSAFGGIEMINYKDRDTVCYITKTKVNDVEAITVRFGNRDFWG